MGSITKALSRFGSVTVFAVLSIVSVSNADAQRKTDQLDRGLVAVKVSSGVYVSWRVQADEYYDVTYNLYRNGALIAQNLIASNYVDVSGSTSSSYTVAAVRNGATGQQCVAVTPWQQQYFEFPVSNVQARSGVTVWKQNNPSSAMANYTINDISLGDVDGDGKIDFIVKRKNQTDQDELFPASNKQMYCQIEVYASTINYGRLWWIDCGPNICYGADEQWDAVAFDWNEDGSCEVLYRGGANTVIHHSDGSTETIGNVNENIRDGITHTANMTFSNSGEEWLMYINGRNGYTYDVISYPLPRGKASDWGDSYGHRSSKYFMGAPYLDGVNPYIFLGRGIYTKIDACAYRVNKNTNKLYKVGNTWHSYNNSGWYGQGHHNFAIADVDEDGSDEIIYGSMVLDFHTGDTSLHGCSSTGLGHGDASHTGDLDPFRRGLETFSCNEERPCNNYRNATTCEIYARTVGSGDDGRAMAGNFTNEYPGGIGASTGSGIIPLSYVQPNPTSPVYINGMANNWNAQTPYPMALNFRIYWDGDLLSETINGPGSNESYLYIDKLGQRIYDTNHGSYATACINYTKKNPCATGDILGDWREEMVMRTSDNRFIRVYTTVTPTEHRMQSLWYDHQYRQAMVWQTEGYNQPPHPSFFVGELEGLTQAPPALTWTGRIGIGNNGSITTAHNGRDVFVWPDGNGSQYSVNINSGAQPSTIFLNSRCTIEGGDRVQYTETKHTWDRIWLTGNGLSGKTNLCKQGASAAHLPYQTHTHTGKTDVWMGALICYGSITNSDVWANRFTELFFGSDLGAAESSYKSISMEYGSALYISSNLKTTPFVNDNGYAHMTVNSLTIKEGSRLVFDINGNGNANGDRLNIGSLFVRKQNWQYGPQYLVPVISIRSNGALADGDYLLGTLQNMASGSASLLDVRVECSAAVSGHFGTVFFNNANKSYYLHVGGAIDASYQIDTAVYEDVLVQNFEGSNWMDNWTIVLGSRLTAVQQSNGASGSKCIWLKSVLDANNGTSAIYTIPAIPEYENTTVYQFDFDFAQTSIIGSNADRAGEFILRDENNNAIATFRAFTGATTGDIVIGGNVVGHYSVTKGTYFKTETAPTINHHVSLRSSGSGTFLYIDGTRITVGSSFVKVGSIIYNTNRYAGQMQFDNIVLNCRIEEEAPQQHYEDVFLDVFAQNYEDSYWMDNWSIVLGSRLTAVQQSNGASGSKCIWLKSVLDANNGTSAIFTLPAIAEYANTTVYQFDFDFAQTSIIGSSADRAGEFILRDENQNAIATFRAFTGATSGEIVVNGNVVGNYSVTKGTYFKTETAPTINHHVSLRSSAAGTTLYIDETPITLATSFVKLGSIIYNTNRYAGQMQFDNFKLNCKVEGAYEIAITNGGFDANDNTGWSGTGFIFQSYTNAEHYNKTFDTYQNLTGLANGWYILTVNGFYRNGLYDDGTDKLTTLYANDAAQAVRLRSSIGLSDLQAATGMTAYPNNMRDAETAFEAGLYGNILRVYVSNGTLRFGVRKSVAKANDWAIFDNFRLFYVGDGNDVPERNMFDEDVTDIENVRTLTAPVTYYTLDGRRTSMPEAGRLYIVKMSDGTTRKVMY